MNTLSDKIQNLIEQKNYLTAEQLCLNELKKSPNSFILLKTLGLLYVFQEKNLSAIEVYFKALKMQENDYDILCNLGHLHIKIEEFQEAEIFAIRASNHPLSNFLPYMQLAELLMKKRDFEKSEEYCELVLKMITEEMLWKNMGFIHIYADVLIAQGKNQKAIQFLHYLETKKFDTEVFQHHAAFSPETISDELIKTAKDFITLTKYNNYLERARNVCAALFGLAKYYDFKKETLIAESYYIEGNKEIAKIQRYLPLNHQKNIQKLKKLFRENFFEKNCSHNNKDEGKGLIFITGMPRSGTTLLESILGSSKESIVSGGELLSMHTLAGKFYLEETEDFAKPVPGLINEIYLKRIRYIRQNNNFFIDKLPGNYHNIGFIKTFLPAAKIINLSRNPWDIAISLFKQFYVSNIPYASNFFNIAINIANYEELIRFFSDEMGFDFLNIQYEDLVSDTESIANKVFDYCGLSGQYDESLRKSFFSRTASKSQITKSIHSSSISKKAFNEFESTFYQDLETQREYWLKNK